MHNQKVIYRSAFIILLAITIMVCPLATGIYSQNSRAYAGQPFNTVQPINATFTPPVGTAVVVPTPIPTLGPGQYFEEGDNLPSVTRPDLLEDLFGYSEIIGETGLFLVWSTDGRGNKHYYVVDEESRYFEKIKAAVDNVHEEYLELIKNGTKDKAVINILKGLGGAFVTGLCGGGTVLSLFATPISAPLTTALATCTGVAGKFTHDSYNEAVDNISSLEGYDFLEEETRKEIEGYFVQIPYSIAD